MTEFVWRAAAADGQLIEGRSEAPAVDVVLRHPALFEIGGSSSTDRSEPIRSEVHGVESDGQHCPVHGARR
ncbi:MAG TPA: hypothetical protein PLM38_01340, partial [Ottowia sp.]|nr:hypothetical protein [Ottowia sp.]